jgi:aspartyl-tRNA(Asn)/glutamyl-tRNA(Gln) amidotransferase subunit A
MTDASQAWQLGLADLGEALRSGALDAEALLAATFERIARLDPSLNSMVALDEKGAREQARASAERLRAGAARSLIEGIPITIKDNLVVRGLPATWGSLGFANFVPDHDELPVERLRSAGAVIVGKTNVPELTLEGYTANSLFGVTRNPWDLRLTPGGSSGGAVAGVAAGLVPAAIGTDGGGSIRRPASHTGLVGFKPSIGRYARADGFPELLSDCEVIGTLVRSVGDTLLLDQVLAGPDGRDRRSTLPPVPGFADPAHLRILYVPRFGDAPLDPEIEAASDAIAGWLAEAGHRVETGPIPFERAETDDIWRIIGRAGVASLCRRRGPDFEASLGPFVSGLAREGRDIGAAEYVEALARIAAFRRHISSLFERYDLVYTPSAAALPWPAENAYPPEIDGQPVGPRGHAIYTAWVNICGHPAINLPHAPSRAGLPIGGQFVANFGADAGLLRFAAWFERARATPWSWPQVALG